MSEENEHHAPPRESLPNRLLGIVERVGNKLPDPAVLFITTATPRPLRTLP